MTDPQVPSTGQVSAQRARATTLTERLREAVQSRFESAEEAVDAIRSAELSPPLDPAAVRAMLDGEREPSWEFLYAARRECGVDHAWLIGGEAGLAEKFARAEEDRVREFHVSFLSGMGLEYNLSNALPNRNWLPTVQDLAKKTGMSPEELGEAIGRPLDALGLDPIHFRYETLDQFIHAMVPAMSVLAEEFDRQYPTREGSDPGSADPPSPASHPVVP